MKKFLVIALAVLCISMSLVGCGNKEKNNSVAILPETNDAEDDYAELIEEVTNKLKSDSVSWVTEGTMDGEKVTLTLSFHSSNGEYILEDKSGKMIESSITSWYIGDDGYLYITNKSSNKQFKLSIILDSNDDITKLQTPDGSEVYYPVK